MSASGVILDAVKIAVPFVTFGLGVVVERWGKLTRRLLRKPPVQIHVETDPRIIYANVPSNWVAAPMFVPLPPDRLGDPPGLQAMSVREWAIPRGGVPCGFQSLQVTLAAWQDLQVVVDAVRVEAKQATLPDGVVVGAQVGGASVERRRIEVELSTWAPSARYVEQGGTDMPNFAFQLSGGEVGRIHIDARVGDYDSDDVFAFDWVLYLDLLVDNSRKTVRIDNNGHPFRLARFDARPMYLASPNGWQLQN